MRNHGVFATAAMAILLLTACAPDPAATPSGSAAATPEATAPAAETSPSAEPPAVVATAMIISIDGFTVVDAEGGELESVGFADGMAAVDFVTELMGGPGAEESGGDYPTTSYTWDGVNLVVVDGGGPASAYIDVAELGGLPVTTSAGIGVGTSVADAQSLGAETTVMPDELRAEVTAAPGTTSLENGGEGVDFIRLIAEDGVVSALLSPANDYGDL